MAANPWNSVFESLPADGATVWVRVLNYYGEPVAATFDLLTETFTSVDTHVTFPVYYVARWKPYP